MKNLLLFFAALCCCMTACTREYSVEPPRQDEDPLYTLAMSVPARFNDGGFTKSSGFTVDEITPLSSIHFSHILYDSLSLPAATRAGGNHADDIYIVNYDHGFSIISDNPDYPEVLAFSDNGRIDASTDHPGMLIFLEDLLEFAPVKDTTIVSTKSTIVIPRPRPLIPVQWGQYAPYNMYAKFCSKCTTLMPVGCVAVAIAQLMTHHKYPAQSRGYSPIYSSSYYTLYNLDWNSIRTYCINQSSFDPTSYDYFPQAVANRDAVRSIFSMVMHELSPDFKCSSGSHVAANSVGDARGALKDLGYTMDGTTSYDVAKVITSLDNGRPVIIFGKNTTSAHAWILDDWISDGNGWYMFHCNWGYDGFGNGYYHTSLDHRDTNRILDENAPNPLSGGEAYSKSREILTNIRKL